MNEHYHTCDYDIADDTKATAHAALKHKLSPVITDWGKWKN